MSTGHASRRRRRGRSVWIGVVLAVLVVAAGIGAYYRSGGLSRLAVVSDAGASASSSWPLIDANLAPHDAFSRQAGVAASTMDGLELPAADRASFGDLVADAYLTYLKGDTGDFAKLQQAQGFSSEGLAEFWQPYWDMMTKPVKTATFRPEQMHALALFRGGVHLADSPAAAGSGTASSNIGSSRGPQDAPRPGRRVGRRGRVGGAGAVHRPADRRAVRGRVAARPGTEKGQAMGHHPDRHLTARAGRPTASRRPRCDGRCGTCRLYAGGVARRNRVRRAAAGDPAAGPEHGPANGTARGVFGATAVGHHDCSRARRRSRRLPTAGQGRWVVARADAGVAVPAGRFGRFGSAALRLRRAKRFTGSTPIASNPCRSRWRLPKSSRPRSITRRTSATFKTAWRCRDEALRLFQCPAAPEPDAETMAGVRPSTALRVAGATFITLGYARDDYALNGWALGFEQGDGDGPKRAQLTRLGSAASDFVAGRCRPPRASCRSGRLDAPRQCDASQRTAELGRRGAAA